MKNLLRTKTGITFLSLCILAMAFSSCSKDGDLLNQKEITSFVFLKTNNPLTADVIGLVNESEKTIIAFVPEGVSLNGLFPTISVSEGATVSPSDEQDFSNPIEYTVTASDGSTTTYTATVAVALSQREILQILIDENPGNTLGWVLQITADLGTLDGVFTDASGNITALVLPSKNLTKLVPEIGQLAHLTQLKLASNEIASIPSEIGLLSILETLTLSGNNITAIPPAIGSLLNLSNLTIESNLLADLPREIGQLTNLTKLDLDANNLTSLPSEVANFQQLESLFLSDNQFSNFPQEIVQLTNLDDLFLSGNSLTTIPTEIENLINLTDLHLDDNQLTSLPDEIYTLTNLTDLRVNANQLTSISTEIGRLTNLFDLYLSDNLLTSIPPEVGFLSQLEELDIRNNNIIRIPVAVCELENHTNASFDLDADPGVSCTLVPTELDVLIGLYAANPDNTLGWSVDNYSGVIFLNDGNIRDIDVRNKDLVRIPTSFGQLSALQVLIMIANEIPSIPPEVGNAITLITLNFQRTGINTVPSTFGQLSNLTELDLTQNPITSIPPGVCDLQVSNGGILTILTDPGEGCI